MTIYYGKKVGEAFGVYNLSQLRGVNTHKIGGGRLSDAYF